MMTLYVISVFLLTVGLVKGRSMPWIVGGLLAALINVVTSPIYYEFAQMDLYCGNSVVVVFDESGRPVFHPRGAFVWEWDKYSHMPARAFEGRSFRGVNEEARQVNPHTKNPQTRAIRYDLFFQIVDPVLFYTSDDKRRSIRDPWLVIQSAREAVEYWLYEFNELHHQNLAVFHNPLDEEQVQQLALFIEEWVNPKLESQGISIEVTEFSLPAIS